MLLGNQKLKTSVNIAQEMLPQSDSRDLPCQHPAHSTSCGMTHTQTTNQTLKYLRSLSVDNERRTDRSWDGRLSERRAQGEGRGAEEVRETIDGETGPVGEHYFLSDGFCKSERLSVMVQRNNASMARHVANR